MAGLRWLGAAADGRPMLTRAIFAATILVVAAVLARAVYVAILSGRAEARRIARGERGAADTVDAWRAAQAEAAAGRYTEAAHLLYRALLETIARHEQLRLHPSKTVGDYVRELRSRRSAAFSPFREFARAYEHVVYGSGTADRQRYERLHALAAPLVTRAAGAAEPRR